MLTDDQRADLLAQAEEETNQAAPWVSGGTYRQIGMALAAAASGNVTGSAGDLLKSAVVDWVQQKGAAEIGKLVEQGTIQESSPEHAALHSILACAGAAASDQSCGSAALGAAATSALSNIFLDKNSNMTDQQKEARAQLIETITTGIAGVVGADPTAALTASQSEADNNLNRKDIEALKKKISDAINACQSGQSAACQTVAQKVQQTKQWVADHPRTMQAVGGVTKAVAGVGLVATIAGGDVPGSIAGVGLVVSGTISATASFVSGVTDLAGAATNTNIESAQKGLDSVSNVPALVTTAATGNPGLGSTVGTLSDAAQLAAKPQEALQNAATLADAVKTGAATASLVKSTLSTPPAQSCSVAGACK